MLGDGTSPPLLTHTDNNTDNTEAEGCDSSNTMGKLLALVVVLRVVSSEAALEDEVVGDGDGSVNGQPVGDQVHEVLQNSLEVGVAGDGNGERGTGSQEGPDETGNALGVAAQDLEGQRDGVDVGAVVGNDGESKNDETELAKSTERVEDGSDQATVTGGQVTIHVLVVITDSGSSVNSNTQKLGEDQGDDQTEPGGEEDLAAATVRGLINSVVRSITGPTGSETVDGRSKGQAGAELGSAMSHRKVAESTRVGKGTQNNDKHNAGRDPAPVLVNVNNLVSGEGDEQGAEGHDEDTSVTGDSAVDSVKHLRTNNGVGSRPTDTGNDVEDGDYEKPYILAHGPKVSHPHNLTTTY